jgi:hypothetical protein
MRQGRDDPRSFFMAYRSRSARALGSLALQQRCSTLRAKVWG